MEPDSAWIPGRGDHASIHANHINMCKFDHREDEGYRSVAGAIKKFAGMKIWENRTVVRSSPQKLDEAKKYLGRGYSFPQSWRCEEPGLWRSTYCWKYGVSVITRGSNLVSGWFYEVSNKWPSLLCTSMEKKCLSYGRHVENCEKWRSKD